MRRALGPLLCAVALSSAPFEPSVAQSTVQPPSSAVLQSVPPIPVSIAAGMNRYGDYRTAHLVAWHPTRREMLIATRFGDTFQLHQVTSPGGERTQITFDEAGVAPIGTEARGWFEPGSDHIIYLRDTGGKLEHQYFHYDPATKKTTRLTSGQGRSFPGMWSPKGDRFAFTWNARSQADFDLYVMALEDASSLRKVAELKGLQRVLSWAPDGRSVLLREFLSATESRLSIVDLETGAVRQVSPDGGEPVSYAGAAFAADGESVFVVSDSGTEFQGISRLDPDKRVLVPLSIKVHGDVDDLALSPDGRWLAFTVNQDVRSLHLFDTKKGTERTGLKTPAGDTSGLQWHSSGEVGFQVSSARMPSDVFSFDPVRNVSTRWTSSETGALQPSEMREYEPIRWRSFDGRQISGILHRPATRFAGRRPVLVNIHGGPEEQARTLFWGRSNYLLNELGIAIIQPNVRGSTGFGKSFQKLDDGKLREGAVKDLGALFNWIAKRPDLDAKRVWLVGNSYGGYLALLAATRYGDRIRCAFVGSGMSNIATWLDRQPPDRVTLRRREYGDERDAEMRKFLIDISPLTRAAEIRTPLLVVHGKNDVQVPVAESQQIVEAVRKNGTPVWYLVFGDEGHGFGRRTNVDFVLYSWVAFAQEYLLK
jgi:dipeptidyl aminopeptidase/acylaminoacyl peptidase